MKKLILIKALALLLVILIVSINSCDKSYTESNISKCLCGKIIDDNVIDYSITVQNNCSGNIKNFKLSRSEWLYAFVDSYYCTNSIKE